jgi:hypothetical protein
MTATALRREDNYNAPLPSSSVGQQGYDSQTAPLDDWLRDLLARELPIGASESDIVRKEQRRQASRLPALRTAHNVENRISRNRNSPTRANARQVPLLAPPRREPARAPEAVSRELARAVRDDTPLFLRAPAAPSLWPEIVPQPVFTAQDLQERTRRRKLFLACCCIAAGLGIWTGVALVWLGAAHGTSDIGSRQSTSERYTRLSNPMPDKAAQRADRMLQRFVQWRQHVE